MITRIIGLDPGLRNTGWGIVEVNGNRLSHIAHGVVHSQGDDDLALRLCQIFQGLCEIIEHYKPSEAAVEETFVNKNPASTLKLGMARGIVMLVPAYYALSVAEYAANRVKKAIVGVGHAEKTQVATMVQHLLPQAGQVTLDAADALAVAICHVQYRQNRFLEGKYHNDHAAARYS